MFWSQPDVLYHILPSLSPSHLPKIILDSFRESFSFPASESEVAESELESVSWWSLSRTCVDIVDNVDSVDII